MRTYDPEKGMSIFQASDAAIGLAQQWFEEVTFEFNGIMIAASPFSHAPDLCKLYEYKERLRPFLHLEKRE